MDSAPSTYAPQAAGFLAKIERRAERFETPCGEGKLVWRRWGRGPTLLLAHGAFGAWSHWARNIDALAEARSVLVPDLPGFGESAMPPSVDHEGIVRVIADGLRQLAGTEAPLDAAGFSFGGVILAYLGLFEPALVRRLVLVDTGGLGTPRGAGRNHRVRGLERGERLAAIRANLQSMMLHQPSSIDELAMLIQDTNSARGRLKARELVTPDKLLKALPHLTMPFDAIWGEFDSLHPDPALQEGVLRGFQADLDFRVIPDAGHWAMYEQPAEFNRALLDLLARPLRERRVNPLSAKAE